MLPLFIIIPLAASVLLSLFAKAHKRVGDVITMSATLALCLLSINALLAVLSKGHTFYNSGGFPAPLGISMMCDGLSVFFLLTINCLTFLVSMYSLGYMDKSERKLRYYFFFMVLLAGLNGVLLSADLFNVFIFIELASIAAYILASFDRKNACYEASFKYAVLGSLSSFLILFAIALIYSKTSSLSFYEISRSITVNQYPDFMHLVTILFIVGFGFKVALVPFHAWAPDAYSSAPSPISAVYSGAVGKVLGIYMILRLFFNVLGMTPVVLSILSTLGVITIVVGVILALYQWDLKRLLAYDSISQVGYIMLGIGLGSPLGMLGGLLHLLNHTVFKSLLFLNAGSIEHSTDTRNLKDMGGLATKMPVTGATSMVASLSISGVPPFNGFWSKLLIIIACIGVQKYWFALFAVLGSILTLAVFLKVQRYAFYGFLKDSFAQVKESPLSMTIPMIILALLCVSMGMLLLPGIDSSFLGLAIDVLERGKDNYSMLAGIIK